MFAICGNKGFHITFENGYTISVQFGRGDYCDNYNKPITHSDPVPPSRDAEVAVWDKTSKWYHPSCVESSGDDVYPHMSPADVAKIIAEVEAL